MDGLSRCLGAIAALGALLLGISIAQGFLGLQMDSVRAVDQAIQDRVRQRGIADIVVPVRHRQLARHDACPSADPVIDQFQEVVAFPGSDGSDGKDIML